MAGATLRVVQYSELERWDVKYFTGRIKSKYPLVPLADFVTEHNEKVRPFETPDETFKILGVNNIDGIFHAYDSLGKEIKQPYKKVSAGDFAYNPYRINIGSIGMVPLEHDGAYISPAYVVFSVNSSAILPEVFWFIMKSNFFNQSLRAATAGSVRMNLTYPLLETLKIPIPPLPIQQKIVAYWEAAQSVVQQNFEGISRLKLEAFEVFRKALGIKTSSRVRPKLFTVHWREVDRWGLELVWKNKGEANSFVYPVKPLKKVCKTGSGGTPSRNHKEYYGGEIPWVKTTEVRNTVITDTDETITSKGLASSSAKLYPAGSLVIAMYGQGATRGRTAKLGVDAATNQACLVLTEIDSALDTDFLWYYLMISYEEMRGLASGNNQPNLSANLLSEFPVPIPPLKKQAELKALIERMQHKVSKLEDQSAQIRSKTTRDIEKMILGTLPVEVK